MLSLGPLQASEMGPFEKTFGSFTCYLSQGVICFQDSVVHLWYLFILYHHALPALKLVLKKWLCVIIVRWKEMVWKYGVTSFMLCSCLDYAQYLRKETKSSFNNISLNINFWKKYNLKQPRLCFKISQGISEWNI